MRILILCLLATFTNNIIAQNPGDKILSIFVDEYGHQWFGTDNGLLLKTDVTYKAYFTAPGIPGTVTQIEQQTTQEGTVMWISTINRLCRVSYSSDGITSSTLFNKDTTKFESDIITAIAFDNKNSGIFATTAGIGIFARNVWNYIIDVPDVSKNRFTSAKAKGDTIYIGTKGEGVARLVNTVDGYTGASSLVSPWSSLAGNNVTCIFIDSKGNRWYGSDQGLARHTKIDAKEGWDFLLADKLQNKNITCMAEDKAGNLWIGTKGGLVVLNPSLVIQTTYTVNNGLPSDMINAIFIEKDGSMWIGTDLGVAHLKGTLFSNIKTSEYTKDFIDFKIVN